MKKFLAILMATAMVLALAACGGACHQRSRKRARFFYGGHDLFGSRAR